MPAMAGTILRREHLVASCLVGTVVVVVGFASGLGLTKPAPGGQQAAQNATPPPASEGTQPGSGASGGSGPVNYVGTPAGFASGPIGGGQVVPIVSVPTSTDVPPTTSESAPPTTTPPVDTSTTGAPPATCASGVLNVLLNQAGTLVNGVPVVGPLEPQIANTLVGSCPDPSTTDTSTPAAVPGLLPFLTPTGTGS